MTRYEGGAQLPAGDGGRMSRGDKPTGSIGMPVGDGIKGEVLDVPVMLNGTAGERQPRSAQRPRRAEIATGVKDAPQASLRR